MESIVRLRARSTESPPAFAILADPTSFFNAPEGCGSTPVSLSLALRHECFWSEFISVAQNREENSPQHRNKEGADAADHDGRHRSKPVRGQAALEFSQFVGRPHKERVNCAHATAHRGWGGQLQQ